MAHGEVPQKLSRPMFTRRNLLKASGLVLVAAPLVYIRGSYHDGVLRQDLSNISRAEGNIFVSIYETVLAQNELPQAERLRVLDFLDRFVVNFGRKERLELKAAFLMVEHLTFMGGCLRRFSRLDLEARTKCLRAWESSALLLYPVFMGMKELSYLACYHYPENYRKIGYEGPVIGGPNDDPEVNGPYEELIKPI